MNDLGFSVKACDTEFENSLIFLFVEEIPLAVFYSNFFQGASDSFSTDVDFPLLRILNAYLDYLGFSVSFG